MTTLFKPNLSRILGTFTKIKDDLEDFLNKNGEEVRELKEKLTDVQAEQNRAERVFDKLRDMLD